MMLKPERAFLFAAMAVVALSWMSVFGKWSWADMQKPIGYCWDGLYILAMMKASADLQFLPFLSKTNTLLGAPGIANWDDFPISEDHVYFIWGLVSRWVGVLAASSLAFLFTAVLSAAVFYWVARKLRASPVAAMVGAALFGLTPFLFYRSLYHFNLTNYWFLPLGALPVIWLSGKQRVNWGSKRMWISAGAAVLFGIHSVYYLNYFLQGLGLCLLFLLFRRNWHKVRVTLFVIAVAVGGFLASNADTLSSMLGRGTNKAAIARNPHDVEVYSLRPIELWVPPIRHRVDAFVSVARQYKASGFASGEFPSPYLGLIVGAAFLLLLLHGIRQLALNVPLGWGRFSLYSIWLVFISAAHGGTEMVQVVSGINLFRSNNRCSIFLFCFGALFLSHLLTELQLRMKPMWAHALALGLLGIGLVDQTPTFREDPNGSFCEPVPVRANLAGSDQRLVAAVEQRVPPDTRVFQLPVFMFPENGAIGGVPDYDPFRPYLYSTKLRFSYGTMKGRPESEWAPRIAQLPVEQMIEQLQDAGFGAIYMLLRAYSPVDIERLLRRLAELGHSEVIRSDAGDSMFVLLKPRDSAPTGG